MSDASETISATSSASGMTMDTEKSALRRYVWTALPLLGVAALLPRLLLWTQFSLTFIAWPWQFDLAEGVNLDATVQLAHGQNIYAPNGPDAFTSAPYTPLFYLLNVPATWITGPSLGFGRTVSMLATLAIALMLFYLVRKITTSWSAGVLAGALWLSISPVIVWSALFTQTTLAPALGVGGLAWTLRAETSSRQSGSTGNYRPLYLAIVLFALAFYTKQTALDAAAATLLWLMLRDFKKGVTLGSSLVGLIALPFLGANRALDGGLWEKVISDHALSWSEGRALRIVGRLWGEYWPLLLWGGAFLAGCIGARFLLARAKGSKSLREALGSTYSLAILYFVIATASVAARLGGDGINYNHLLDMLVPLCLLVGLAVGWIIRWLSTSSGDSGAWPFQSPRAFAFSGVALCALLLAAQVLEFNDPHTWYSGMWPDPARDGQMNALSRLVATTPGDFLSDDAYLLLRNGRRDTYDDTFMLVSLAALGRWDDSTFVQSLRDRRYSLMFLFDLDRWSPTERQALANNYTLKFRDVLSTYSPLVSPLSYQYPLSCTLANAHDSIALEGYSLAPGVASDGIARGDVLRTTLYWQPSATPTGDYASYLHLVSDGGQSVASQDNPHTGALRPTIEWSAGSVVTDTASLPIPSDLPPGRYRLVAGMYIVDRGTGALQSLPATCQSDQSYGDAVSLGWVQVR